jgi:hypothetical protein
MPFSTGSLRPVAKIALAKRFCPCYIIYLMVDVAQLAEHWVVAPDAEGSSPFIHPI